MSVNCRLSCDRCQYVSKTRPLLIATGCCIFIIVCLTNNFLHQYPHLFVSSMCAHSIVRVTDRNDIRKYIEQKRKDTEPERQAKREAREVRNILAGEL